MNVLRTRCLNRPSPEAAQRAVPVPVIVANAETIAANPRLLRSSRHVRGCSIREIVPEHTLISKSKLNPTKGPRVIAR